MKKLLVTGGTVFVSKYVAEYFVKKGEDVYVLNRNNYPQSKGNHFDAVLDINTDNGDRYRKSRESKRAYLEFIDRHLKC